MTLILNILHKDISVLAADKKATAEWLVSPMFVTTVPLTSEYEINDFNKVTTNSSKTLAIGIAGRTQDHDYTQVIEQSDSIDVGLGAIRNHIERFVPTYDREILTTLTTFMPNEGIASFYDQSTGTYYTSKYLFSPIEIHSRLHRGVDEVKIISAGSGSKHFATEDGLAYMAAFIASAKNACTPDACISWMKYAFERVSKSDPGTGAESVFLVSTRSSPEFRSI